MAAIAHIIDRTNYHNNDFYLADLFTFAKLITQSDLLWKEFIDVMNSKYAFNLSEAGRRLIYERNMFYFRSGVTL